MFPGQASYLSSPTCDLTTRLKGDREAWTFLQGTWVGSPTVITVSLQTCKNDVNL